jgi:hypothetical protein
MRSCALPNTTPFVGPTIGVAFIASESASLLLHRPGITF